METGPWKPACVRDVIPMGPSPFRIPSQVIIPDLGGFHARESYPRFMPIYQIFRDLIFLDTFPSLPSSLLTFERTSEGVEFEKKIESLAFIN